MAACTLRTGPWCRGRGMKSGAVASATDTISGSTAAAAPADLAVAAAAVAAAAVTAVTVVTSAAADAAAVVIDPAAARAAASAPSLLTRPHPLPFSACCSLPFCQSGWLGRANGSLHAVAGMPQG